MSRRFQKTKAHSGKVPIGRCRAVRESYKCNFACLQQMVQILKFKLIYRTQLYNIQYFKIYTYSPLKTSSKQYSSISFLKKKKKRLCFFQSCPFLLPFTFSFMVCMSSIAITYRRHTIQIHLLSCLSNLKLKKGVEKFGKSILTVLASTLVSFSDYRL